MLTLNELKERMAYKMDALEIIEHLEITEEDLCDAFEDRIDRMYDKLYDEVADPLEDY